jgi:hypothetical protein
LSDLIQDIEEWGKLLFTLEETADAVGISYDELLANDEYIKAYKRGRMIAIGTHKKKIVTLANQGSGPAQTLLEKIRKEEEINKILNAW